ncbi:alpha/beta hydrolase fold protein [Deinococcus geothermalis DSM 11300]|uniref:Alpha/beta hydrolase fold protein n=1 Tax=Deinococcus geothermalis (strain DSM 11300 / CIP 105573 / AG-3a) TaxID=319795 RepID=Q1IWV1_DEIGD|nr:alpha/beta hydrolase [Deinococcus geothermalis]ABF46283.1 alpha/beta hydrolase fold protein [Deinococcus geothermalis DSM 11300]
MTELRPQTVLLLHAYPLSAAMWAAQKAALEAAGLTVLAPNLPGFGGADGAMTSLANTARDLLKTLPPEPAALVGLSMGGYLALELLAQAPDRFARVVLADTSARADDEEKQKDRREQADRVLAEGQGFIIAAAREEHLPETFARIRPMIEAATPQGIAGALRAMAARPDQRATLRRLKLPLLALVGEQDTLTPPDLAGEIAELGHGERQIIPGARHLSNLDAPEAFNAALLAFLA